MRCGDTAKLFFEENSDSLSVISLEGSFQEEGKELNELQNSLLELPALEAVHITWMPSEFQKDLETRGVLWKRDSCDYDV